MAKAPLEMALRPPDDRGAVANEAAGMAAVGARLQVVPPTVRVLEATGGAPRAVVAALAAARRRVAGVKPRPGRDVAKATGPLAQTEARAARALAPVAEAVRPPPRPLPDAQAAELRARRARRRHLVTRRTAAQNRLGSAPSRLQTDLQAPLPGLTERLARLDDELDTARRASPGWRAREELWRRVPGMGPVWTRTRLLDLPALGTLSRQRLAALVGVAPLHRDRGTRRGSRMLWGGGAHVRASRSMSALVAVRDHAVLKACDERLRAAGKPAKVALAACMRTRWTILNAMVKHPTPWPPQEGLGA